MVVVETRNNIRTNYILKAALTCQISGRDHRNLAMPLIPFVLNLSILT